MKLQLTFSAVLGTALVAALFSLIVGLLLAIDFVGRGNLELFDTPQYLKLKEQLAAHPDEPELQQDLRQLDQQLREHYFRHRRFMTQGIYLLAGGLVLSLVTARWAAHLRPELPRVDAAGEQQDLLAPEQQKGRKAVVALALAVIVLMGAFALNARRILPPSVDQLLADAEATIAAESKLAAVDDDGASAEPAADGTGSLEDTGSSVDTGDAGNPEPVARQVELPSQQEYLNQWPRFRGPTGAGATDLTDIPQEWNVEDGTGVLWKVSVPLPGPNSPVVWGKQVFVSGATAEEQAVFCYNADTGELAWRCDLPVELAGSEEYEVAEYTGYAAPSLATDGLRVYALFASGNLAAIDLRGDLVWRKNLGVPKNSYGHASSLATYRDRVIVQIDQGRPKDEASKLMAFEGTSGDLAWEVIRPVPASWASPIVVEHQERPMVITCAEPAVIAYDPVDGTELWRADVLSGEVGPSPVFEDGVIYAANEACGLFAIRADGAGDVTETHVEWFTDIDVPDVCSPLVVGPHILLVSYGLVAAFELGKSEDPEESREPLWEEDFAEISSSPARVGDTVYLFSEEGPVWIVKPGAEECERLGELEMGEPIRSSPAFMPGRIYIRGEEHLFCLGS